MKTELGRHEVGGAARSKPDLTDPSSGLHGLFLMLSAMEHDTTPLGTKPDPDPDKHRRPRPHRLRRLATGLALGITTAGVPMFGIAATSGASGTDDVPAFDEVVEVTATTGDCNADALPADVVASINEDEDALAAFLDERGITSTRETYTDGVRWVAWDEEDDAANTAVDQFYAEHYPLSPEDLAEATVKENALAAFLDQQGITYTRQPGPDGVNYVAWDEEDDAANTAVDQFYAEHYPLSPEELAQMNAEEDALAAFLDQQGITYTRQPGPEGVNYVAWDEEDDAANTAVDQFYTSTIDACVVSVP